MICDWLDGLSVGGDFKISCVEGMLHSVSTWVSLLVIMMTICWTVLRVHRGRFLLGESLMAHAKVLAAGLMMVLAALVLAAASSKPVLVWDGDTPAGHIVAVIDVSNSVTRDARSFEEGRASLARAVGWLTDNLGQDDRARGWSGSVVIFAGSAALAAAKRPIFQLKNTLRSLPTSDFDAGDSDVAAGLRFAREQIAESGGAGIILLLSDGNWLSGDTEEEVGALRRSNIPVYPIPVGSSAPGQGIVAADLSASTEIGAIAVARLVVGAGVADHDFDVTVRQDDQEEAEIAAKFPADTALSPIRVETIFRRRGVRYLDLGFRTEGRLLQSRHLYTLVKAPPRVLVFGDAPWAELLAPDQFEVIRAKASAPLPAPEEYDVIVVDGLAPDQFAADYPERLAQAVAGAGRGLFVINGHHSGSIEDETVMGHWENTSLGPLLPVSTDMRAAVIEPPPRDIAIIFDTSGSMDGWPLHEAKRIGARVLADLRPVDHLTLIAFGNGHSVLLDRARMNLSGSRQARDVIGGLTAAGGSFAGGALEAVSGLKGNSCALFFISDGAIDGITHKPGCETVVFEISGRDTVINRALERLGQVIPVDNAGLRGGVRIKYLDPEIREERWRVGIFTPLAVSELKTLTPSIPVDGIAISYPRPEAERISVHPAALPDPVLVLREDLRGSVAAFLGDLGGLWSQMPEGVEAIQETIKVIAGWSDPDRYRLKFSENPGGLSLDVLVLAKPNFEIPDRLEAKLSVAGGATSGLPLQSVAGEAGRFVGFIPFPSSDDGEVLDGVLHISEIGDSVLQRTQKIPVHLPLTAARSVNIKSLEVWSFGTDTVRLAALAGLTGGQLLTSKESFLKRGESVASVTRPVHTWALALAASFFVAGLWLGGGRL